MKTVYLSNNDIIDAVNLALHTYAQHYNRINLTKKHRAVYIIQGKLGEIAVAKYCKMIGIKTSPNLLINTGIDTADLTIYKRNIAIKSKTFNRIQLPPLDEIYLHIPINQYLPMMQHETIAVVATCLQCATNRQIESWLKILSLKVDILGGLMFTEYDKLKELHQAGEEISPGFRLPPPSSFGVKWSDLYDFDVLLDEIKSFKKKGNGQLYLYEKGIFLNNATLIN